MGLAAGKEKEVRLHRKPDENSHTQTSALCGLLAAITPVSLIVYNPVWSEIHYAEQAGLVSAFASALGLKAHAHCDWHRGISFCF